MLRDLDDKVEAYDYDGKLIWTADIAAMAKGGESTWLGDLDDELVVLLSPPDEKARWVILNPETGRIMGDHEPDLTNGSIWLLGQPSASKVEGEEDFFFDPYQSEEAEDGAALLPHEQPRGAPMALECTYADTIMRRGEDAGFIYIRENELFWRKSERIPVDVYKELFIADYKKSVRNVVNQAALATKLYASDYDNHLPLLSMLPDALGPYIREYAVLDGIAFLREGDLSQISNPATTVIAYRDTPYGRIFIYADSKTAWDSP